MKPSDLNFYRRFASLRWPASYTGKLLLVAFFGTHVPLLGLVIFVALSASWSAMWALITIALLFTLLGMFITLFVQSWLLAPIEYTTEALVQYLDDGTLPDLPTEYTDAAGLLMEHTQRTITRLDEHIRFKNRLLRVLSHDARTPVASVIMASETIRAELQEQAPDLEVLDEMAKIIRHSAQYQLGLLDNLMMASEAEATHFQVRTDRITLHTLLELVVKGTHLLAAHKEITVEINAQSAAPMILDTDVSKLKQVLTNLLSNAIKFSPRGTRIEVGATVSAGTLLIYVEDQGIGITEAQMAHLFEPFSETQQLGTEEETGFGLGLWVSKTFTELLGGFLDVTSEPGKGSTFIVHFPVKAVQQAKQRAATSPSEAQSLRHTEPERERSQLQSHSHREGQRLDIKTR